jgi:formate C-acetyltransferase
MSGMFSIPWACSIAKLSVLFDSLSAIKYAKVKVLKNKVSLVVNYQIEGDYPKCGN